MFAQTVFDGNAGDGREKQDAPHRKGNVQPSSRGELNNGREVNDDEASSMRRRDRGRRPGRIRGGAGQAADAKKVCYAFQDLSTGFWVAGHKAIVTTLQDKWRRGRRAQRRQGRQPAARADQGLHRAGRRRNHPDGR
jgi:hypothetical protein